MLVCFSQVQFQLGAIVTIRQRERPLTASCAQMKMLKVMCDFSTIPINLHNPLSIYSLIRNLTGPRKLEQGLLFANPAHA
jgi:hypothetical protein